MDLGAITALFADLDPAALIPELNTFLGRMEFFVRLLVLIGPLLLLGLGLWYLLKPPKEANHRIGFQALWGMGSVKAWRYTQRLAGICYTGLGGLLTIIMFFVSLTFKAEAAMDMVSAAVTCLIWQAALTLICYIAINVVVALFFDWKGNVRKKK